MKTRVVLFDLYKTLIYILLEIEDIELWRKLSQFLRYKNVHSHPERLRDSFFGCTENIYRSRLKFERYPEIDIVGVFRSALGEKYENIDDRLLVDVLQLYRSLSTLNFGIFNDVRPTLAKLKQTCQIGLVTNAHRIFAEPELNMLDLYSTWDVIIMSSDHGIAKPDPRLFAMALEHLNLTPDEAIYVGDSLEHDVIGAHAAGIRAVHLIREENPSNNLTNAQPEWTINRLEQLMGILD